MSELFNGRRVDVLIPTAVRDVMADPTKELLALFGADGIVDSDWDEEDGPIRPPLLRIVPIETGDKRMAFANQLGIDYLIRMGIYLPRFTPARRSVAPPGKPVATLAGAGSLTGAYVYAATAFDSTGESFVGMTTTTKPVPLLSDAVTAAGNAISVTASGVGGDGWRLWRTRAGGMLPRLLATLPASVTTFVDDVADAELGDEVAPIRGLAQAIKGYVLQLCVNAEPLTKGDQLTDPVTRFRQVSDAPLRSRNLRLITLETVWPLIASADTRESSVAVPG